MLRAGDGEYSGAKTRSMSAAYCNAIFASLLAKYWLGTTAPSGISWSGQGLFMRASISTIGWCLSAHCGDSSSMIATFRDRSEEHTSELQSLMRISYAVFCLITKKQPTHETTPATPNSQ